MTEIEGETRGNGDSVRILVKRRSDAGGRGLRSDERSRVPHDKLQVSQIVRSPTCGEPRINQWEILEDPTHPRVSAVISNILLPPIVTVDELKELLPNDSLNFLSNNCQDKPHDQGFL